MLLSDAGVRVGIGTHRESISNFMCYPGNEMAVTNIPKSQEWHEFKFGVTKGVGVTSYIDGVEMGRTDEIDRFSQVQIGEHAWRGRTAFVGDVSIEMKP